MSKPSHGRGLTPIARAFIREQVLSHWLQFVALFFLSLVGALIEMTGVGLVFPLLIILVAPDRLGRIPELETAIESLGIARADLPPLLMGLIAATLVGKNSYMLFLHWLTTHLVASWKTALSRRLIHTYLYSDYSVYLAKTSSEIIRNMSLSAAIFDQYITGMINLMINAMILVGLCALLVFVLPPETLAGIALIIAAAVLIYFSMRKPFARIGADLNELHKRRQALLRQCIGMVKETKLSAREDYFLDAYVGVEHRNFQRQAHSRFMSYIPPVSTESAVIVAVLSIISYILFFSAHADFGLALLGLMAATFFRLTPVINRLLSALQILNISRNSVEIVAKELHDLEPHIFRSEVEPAPLPFEHDIRLENVSFSYPGTEIVCIRNLDLGIGKGEMIGITGPSGAGKSTLAALILGLMPPTTGRVLVDGVPLDTRGRIRAWHKHIGFVPQGVFLIEDTIARNVAFAAHDIDEDKIWRALETVQLRSFVESLPDGIHTFVGEDGCRLSGGQGQRLGIARVLYDEPKILVFDEATSALDAATEKAFSDSLMRLRGVHTLIMIAHRLSTLRDCDRIVMMEDGTVLDSGRLSVLEARCPQFRRLVELSQLEKAPLDKVG